MRQTGGELSGAGTAGRVQREPARLLMTRAFLVTFCGATCYNRTRQQSREFTLRHSFHLIVMQVDLMAVRMITLVEGTVIESGGIIRVINDLDLRSETGWL